MRMWIAIVVAFLMLIGLSGCASTGWARSSGEAAGDVEKTHWVEGNGEGGQWFSIFGEIGGRWGQKAMTGDKRVTNGTTITGNVSGESEAEGEGTVIPVP